MWTQESFLGGVASRGLGRLSSSNAANGFVVHGYGFFFTSKRLVGVSYSRITLVAYLIPFGIFLLWLGILVPVMAWGLQVDPSGQGFPLPLPVYILGPPLLGLPILVAAYVFYFSPRRVATKIEQQRPTSTQDLFSVKPDIALDRSDISEIIIERNPDWRFHFAPKATILMSTGEQYFFDAGNVDIYQLLGDFCNLDPAIKLTYQTPQLTFQNRNPSFR